MRLPRMTTRWLMAAVAIIAVLLFGVVLGRRSWDLRSRAEQHAQEEMRAREYATEAEHVKVGAYYPNGAHVIYEYPNPNAAVERSRYLAEAEYHAQLKRKYRRAMSRPWFAVPPDPPDPAPLPPAREPPPPGLPPPPAP